MNEIMTVEQSDIAVRRGTVNFVGYERLFEQAEKLAKHIESVEVTDANLSESKRLLSEVNKEVGKLEKERIRVKKLMLEPYEDLETKIKLITSTVQKASDVVKAQTRNLEELERAKKQKKIESIFKKRAKMYDFMNDGIFTFHDFLKQPYMNKTFAMTKIEMEMASWFVNIESDYAVINKSEHVSELLVEYSITKHLSTALQRVSQRQQALESIVQPKKTPNSVRQQRYNIVQIDGSENFQKVLDFMQTHDIGYNIK